MKKNEQDFHHGLIIIPSYFNIFGYSNRYYNLQLGNDLKVRIGFDVVSISFLTEYLSDLFDYLKGSGFRLLIDNEPRKGLYQRYRLYHRRSEQIEIQYQARRINSYYINRDLLKIHFPKPHLIRLIKGFFRYKTHPLLSQIEISFDFYCQKKMMRHFRHYMEGITFFKHNRKPCFRYINPEDGSETFYASDRKYGRSSTAWKFYGKENADNGNIFLRMEITLSRQSCMTRGLSSLSDLPKVWDLDLSNMLTFSKINYTKLSKHLGKLSFKRYMKNRRSMGRRPEPNRVAQIESAVKRTTMDVLRLTIAPRADGIHIERKALMEQIDVLKGRGVQYSQFLQPVEDQLFSYLQLMFRKNGRLWRRSREQEALNTDAPDSPST